MESMNTMTMNTVTMKTGTKDTGTENTGTVPVSIVPVRIVPVFIVPVFIVPVLIVLVSIVSCRIEIDDQSARRVNDDSAAEAEIMRTLGSYYDALSALDSAAFLAHFWPGADVTTAWRPPGADSVEVVIMPVTRFVAQWAEGPGSRAIFEERMLEGDVNLRGDLAQAWVHYEARFGDSTDLEEWRGIDAFTLMRRDGTWRIVELAFAAEQ